MSFLDKGGSRWIITVQVMMKWYVINMNQYIILYQIYIISNGSCEISKFLTFFPDSNSDFVENMTECLLYIIIIII